MLALLFGLCFVETPPLSDLERFPSPEQVAEQMAWADNHLAWLDAQRQLDLVNVSFWQGWYNDARSSRQPWRELQLARGESYGEAWRRRRLADLKYLIGPEDYAAGRMPSVVPLSRLKYFVSR